jgi:hypothetical protein
MELPTTSEFYFILSRVGVSQELYFIFNQMREGDQ